MSLSQYAQAVAGRLAARRATDYAVPNTDAPVVAPARPVATLPATEDGTGIWIAACLVQIGDQVQVADRWLTVASVTTRQPDAVSGGARAVLLTMVDGSMLAGEYMSRLYVRDEASQIAAEIGGAK